MRSIKTVVEMASRLFKRFPDVDQELLVGYSMKVNLADRMQVSERAQAIDVINSSLFGGSSTMAKLLKNFTTLNDKALINSDFETIFEVS